MKGIRVLVVDDSPIMRELLAHILNSDPDLQVVGFAKDGEEALVAIDRLAPDVVTMDIEMPRLDGYETTRRIMASRPVPVVIVSSRVQPEEVATAFHTAQSGALA
ncbi:MAG TPA: response regulator, partial [Abditibacteriaceae bacterium]